MRRTILGLTAGLALIAGGGLVLAHAGHAGLPPPTVVFATRSEALPFELFRGNRIVISARINGHETLALLDTGASATTVDRSFARSIGMPEGIKIEGKGAGGSVDAELVSGATIQLGGTRLDKVSVGVMDLAPVSRAIGRPLTLILGRDFFNASVITIDWAKNHLEIHDPRMFSADNRAVALNLTRAGPFNTIPVSVAGAPSIEALLDLGNGGTLILPPTYWNSRPELANLRSAESRVGGVGGMGVARAVMMPQVTFAGRTFTNIPAVLAESGNDREPTQMANVGIGLLRQFKVNLDLGRDRIYLTPRTDAPPFERDRAGARFELIGDRLKVAFAAPEGPVAKAGLKAGEEIVAVNGKKVGADYYAQPEWIYGPAGTQVTLTRGDGSMVRLRLADYY